MAPLTNPFPFLNLPLELREAVYSLYFKPADHLVLSAELEAKGYHGGVYKFDTGLWSVNKQIHQESTRVWKRENVFVKIATPWPTAGMYRVYLMALDVAELPDLGPGGKLNHISSEGLVPIVCKEDTAYNFDQHHALVIINAPFHRYKMSEHTVVVLLDDLHLFTQTWHYSALSYPMLNDRLFPQFILQDPTHQEGSEESKGVSIALQRRLLLPFEQIKGLFKMEVSGYAPSVAAELRRRMAIPVPTLQQCCEDATELMAQGDTALATNNPLGALELYKKAFHAIHILVHGRTRRVLADIFFHEDIEHGRYAGQTGMTVRVILRLQLVSRTIAAYLKTAQWGEAAYWGMRSIRIMSEAMDSDFEDFLSEFLGGGDVGLIYSRTAIAFMMMEQEGKQWDSELTQYANDNLAGSASLWLLAAKYLKSRNKEGVRKELQECGVPQETINMFGDAEESDEEASMMGNNGSDDDVYWSVF